MNDRYLKESLNTQRLNDLAKKYNLQNYIPGQSFDSVKDSMSAQDYETSQKLLNNYINQENLTNDFYNNTNTINKNRTKALQENAISRELTMKYLPEYLKMQGLGGLGVSQSNIIETNNNFRNARNLINSNIENQKAELLRNYQNDMNVMDKNSTNEIESINDKYSNIRKELANNEATVIEEKFLKLLADDEKISQEDFNSLKAYVEGLKETIGAENLQTLKTQLEGYTPYIRTEEEQEKYDFIYPMKKALDYKNLYY